VSGKKRPQYSRHNFDKLGRSYVIFGTNHSDTSAYSNVRKFTPKLQHRYVEMTSYLTPSKMKFTKDGHLTKAFLKEKHDTASQLLKEYVDRN